MCVHMWSYTCLWVCMWPCIHIQVRECAHTCPSVRECITLQGREGTILGKPGHVELCTHITLACTQALCSVDLLVLVEH